MRKFYGHIIILFFTLTSSVPQHAYAQISARSDGKKGLTFESRAEGETNKAGIFTASCGKTPNGKPSCNPNLGDTSCQLSRPVLCLLDIDAPVPDMLTSPQYWAGGILALSSPELGSRFKRLSDTNAYCAATFGEGWRVASFHDGGGWALKGYGVPQNNKERFWVDIKNKPEGTCWAR